MQLRALILSSNPTIVSTIADVFGQNKIDVRIREDAASAIAVSESPHFDGIVVDCDTHKDGLQVLDRLRDSRSNGTSIVFAVVNGSTTVADALDHGANFVVGAPIDTIRLRTYLEIALPKMHQEHRRYFRHKLAAEVEVIDRDGKIIPGRLLNVSEGGFAVTLPDAPRLDGMVGVRVTVPGVTASPLQAKVLVTWTAGATVGMRIVYMSSEHRFVFEKWLQSLELQTA